MEIIRADNEKEFCVAVCDDNISVHKTVEKLLEKYEKERNCKLADVYFSSGQELLEYGGRLEILLLDIEMPGIDGIEVGHKLRNGGKECRIIMLTGIPERFKDAFKIGAMRFVTKPVTDSELFEALDAAIDSFLGCQKIRVRYKGKDTEIYQYQIDYIEARKDYLRIFSGDKIYDRNQTLKAIEEELDTRLFARAGKSFIVNLGKIKQIKKNILLLPEEREVKVSRRVYKDCMDKYNEYDAKGYSRVGNGTVY